jgi:two-component system, response regulator PdtaR
MRNMSTDSDSSKILVVEDERSIATDLARVLRELGFAVTGTVDTAQKAIASVEEDPPDLILMDITLNGKRDGIAVAHEIKNRFGIPSVYLTAYSDEETLSRAELTEPFGFLLKPFSDRELYTVLRLALHRRKMENELAQAADRLQVIHGLLHVCASCKKIQDEEGCWKQLETYLRDHSEAECSHSLCPECERKLLRDPAVV